LAKIGMSEKTIESYGKGFLVLLLPISFLIIFLVATWKIWLAGFLLVLFFNVWQYYRWQKWCLEVNPLFNQLVRENQGKITPIDLAIKGNFSGDKAKRYLLAKAKEFGASTLGSEDEAKVFYFMTASALGSILDSSEPPKELSSKIPTGVLPLFNLPEPKQEQEQETELPLHITDEEVKQPLAKQLVFGSLIQSELAKRLNVYSSTVYKRREDPDFPQWSKSKDPDGIAWTYSRKTKEFFPQEENKS
jgi:hypothetical protein